MDSDIRDAIESMMIREGRVETLDKLAKHAGVKRRSIQRWIDHGAPDGHSAYLLALACGKNEEEAIAIGKRHSLSAVTKRVG